jgi:hypothetical protein
MEAPMVSPLLVAAVVIATLFTIQVLLSNRVGAEAEVRASLAAVSSARWYFVALEYYSGISNRTYVVLVTNDAICGAIARHILPAPIHVTDRWHDPLFYPRPALVAKYRELEAGSVEFLAKDRANFRLGREEVEGVDFTADAKWGMGKVPYSGRLLLSLRGGRRRELILLGTQDGLLLRDRLRGEGFGQAQPAPAPSLR